MHYSTRPNGNTEILLGSELEHYLHSADYIVMNLEVPLTDKESHIPKCGLCLLASTNTASGLKKINPYLFTLANNHILDQGNEGLESTFKTLKDAGIKFFGAGHKLQEAAKPYYASIGEKRVGFYGCVEHEFSQATDKTPGASLYDPLEIFDIVHAMKERCDYTVVLYHGGKEHYRYPSPRLQKVCRKFVSVGADLVICQHSHCIGCKEEYLGKTIVYGQGNFLFDHSDEECWKTGLIIELNLENGEIEYRAVRKQDNGVRLANNEDSKKIIAGFLERSEQIKNLLFVNKAFSEFSSGLCENYERAFLGKAGNNVLFRILNKLSGRNLARKYFNSEQLLALENYVLCEAHSEVVAEMLRIEIDRSRKK